MKSFPTRNFVRLQGKLFFIGLCMLPPLLSGCYPLGLPYSRTDINVMAVRFENYNHTNYVVEKLVETHSESGMGYIHSLDAPGITTFRERLTFYVVSVSKVGIDRIGLKKTEIKCLPSLENANWTRENADYQIDDWAFWPVPRTNLWLAVNCVSNSYWERRKILVEGRNIRLNVYLFLPEKIIQQKQLTVFLPANNNDGYPDFQINPLHQQITYKTRSGYETYSFLEDTTVPCEAPSGEPALPIKPRPKGFDLPLTLFIQGRPIASYRE